LDGGFEDQAMRVNVLNVVFWAAGALLVIATPAYEQGPRVVDVTAERFTFSPSEITVRTGEAIEFRVHSEDTAHGFRIGGTAVNGVVPKRGKGVLTVTTTFDRAGRYTIECTRMCGAGHDFMRGIVVVRDATERGR
jgi:heme/copper-type cytochrome/quinol oxidase subunit 2